MISSIGSGWYLAKPLNPLTIAMVLLGLLSSRI